MANAIKYTTGSETVALKKGNFYIGNNSVGKGPTSETGYYNGISPPSGGYTIYVNNTSLPGGLSYFSAANDSQLISFTNNLAGTSYTTAQQCFDYYYSQTDKVLVNQDYPTDFPYIVMDGLIFYVDAGVTLSYPGNGTTWYDVNGLGPKNNGTLTNGPTFNSGNGGCIVFDGADDYVIIPNTANTNWGSQITVGITFFNGGGDYRGLINQGYYYTTGWEWRLGREDSGRRLNGLIQNTSNVQVFSSFLTNLNQWNVVYLTYDGSSVKGYLNGVLQTTESQTGNIKISSYNMCIGMRGLDNPGEYFNNKIALSQIYNRALSQSEITQNYNAQKSRFGI